jgi:hypothetical protein
MCTSRKGQHINLSYTNGLVVAAAVWHSIAELNRAAPPQSSSSICLAVLKYAFAHHHSIKSARMPPALNQKAKTSNSTQFCARQG